MSVKPSSTAIIKTGGADGLLKFTSAPACRIRNINQGKFRKDFHM